MVITSDKSVGFTAVKNFCYNVAMTALTLELSTELAERLQPFDHRLPELLERGMREVLLARSSALRGSALLPLQRRVPRLHSVTYQKHASV